MSAFVKLKHSDVTYTFLRFIFCVLYPLDQTLRLLFISSPNLCGIYSRVATNRGWRLLISVNSNLIPRPIPHFQCTLDTGRRWIREQTCSWWLHANCILLAWTSQATPHLQYSYWVTRFVDMRTCHSKPSLAAATIREWPLFLSAHLEVWLLFKSSD